MVDFQGMFVASKGKPVNHQGKTLHMMDELPVAGLKKIVLIFEQTDSEWRQGVSLQCDSSFRVIGEDCGKHVVFWEDTAPESVEVELVSNAEFIVVKNVWDIGDGVMDSWHNGAAMIIDELSNGRRYRCNDGKADDDFDDIIFRLEFCTA